MWKLPSFNVSKLFNTKQNKTKLVRTNVVLCWQSRSLAFPVLTCVGLGVLLARFLNAIYLSGVLGVLGAVSFSFSSYKDLLLSVMGFMTFWFSHLVAVMIFLSNLWPWKKIELKKKSSDVFDPYSIPDFQALITFVFLNLTLSQHSPEVRDV